MAFSNATTDAIQVSPSAIMGRLLSAIMRAREAQAQHRMMSQLRDLPDDVLQDIGVAKSDLTRLRNGRPPAIFHAG